MTGSYKDLERSVEISTSPGLDFRPDRQIRELALEHAAGHLEDEV